MGIKIRRMKTPAGHDYLEAVFFDAATGPDAQTLIAEMRPGGKSHGLPLLSYPEGPEPKMETAFREQLGELAPKKLGITIPVAMVIKSTTVRVAVEFILRVMRHNANKPVSNREEGLVWLDEQIPLFLAKKPPYA